MNTSGCLIFCMQSRFDIIVDTCSFFFFFQHRMAGLAVIEVAQKVSKAWRSLQAEWKYANKSTSKTGRRSRRRERISMASQNRGGPGCSTSSSEPSTSYSSIDDRSSKRLLSWHDVYSLAVRWRQISEPCDPVVWINKLRYFTFILVLSWHLLCHLFFFSELISRYSDSDRMFSWMFFRVSFVSHISSSCW